jgi:hypothetical protein
VWNVYYPPGSQLPTALLCVQGLQTTAQHLIFGRRPGDQWDGRLEAKPLFDAAAVRGGEAAAAGLRAAARGLMAPAETALAESPPGPDGVAADAAGPSSTVEARLTPATHRSSFEPLTDLINAGGGIVPYAGARAAAPTPTPKRARPRKGAVQDAVREEEERRKNLTEKVVADGYMDDKQNRVVFTLQGGTATVVAATLKRKYRMADTIEIFQMDDAASTLALSEEAGITSVYNFDPLRRLRPIPPAAGQRVRPPRTTGEILMPRQLSDAAYDLKSQSDGVLRLSKAELVKRSALQYGDAAETGSFSLTFEMEPPPMVVDVAPAAAASADADPYAWMHA